MRTSHHLHESRSSCLSQRVSNLCVWRQIEWWVIHSLRWTSSLLTILFIFADHGLFSVTLDNQSAVTYDGVAGCGGAFGKTCEQIIPSLGFVASNLDSSLHTITVTNIAGANNSYFGK